MHDGLSEEPVVGFQLGRVGNRQYFWSLELAWDTAGRPRTRRHQSFRMASRSFYQGGQGRRFRSREAFGFFLDSFSELGGER